MLVKNVIKNKIVNEFISVCENKYSLSSDLAPQGQNSYSTNLLIKNTAGTTFLLKVLLLGKIPGANRDQVDNEADVYKSVNSPYVVKLVDFYKTANFVFLVFPFLEGKTLNDVINEEGKLAEARVKELGISILRGIADIYHRSGSRIIHQDLKPENIFITNDGNVLLLDFGAARYKQSPFRGSARHNFAYSSREQIRASRPNTLEELRITLSDKADVFSVGLILYKLLEGNHPHQGLEGVLPADAILEARPIPPITVEGISNGMKKILWKTLEYEPLGRYNALDAISALEYGDIKAPTLDKGKFYYCSASSVGRCVKFKKDHPELIDGLVVESSKIPKTLKQIADLHTDVMTLIIDPQTYLFQKPEQLSADFKNRTYYTDEFLEMFSDPVSLIGKIKAKDIKVIDFIKKVFRFQINCGADVLIPPYFYIPEFNDNYWTIDQEISEISVEIYKSLSVAKPLIKGIAISEEVLESDSSRNRIVEYVQSLYDYTGFFVLIDSSHNETITSEAWLKSAKLFFTDLLATQKFVLWSRAELFGLALANLGLSMATGEFQKQRRFNITLPPQQFGRRSKHYYLPMIFAKVKWTEGFRAISRHADHLKFSCNCRCCNGIDFSSPSRREEEDLALHFLISVRNQFNIYAGENGKAILTQNIKDAVTLYESIRTHRDVIIRSSLITDIKPGSSTFLTSWINVLGIK